MEITTIVCDKCGYRETIMPVINIEQGRVEHHDPMRADRPSYFRAHFCGNCARTILQEIMGSLNQNHRNTVIENIGRWRTILKEKLEKGELNAVT